jgi:prepilin-type N-terminal cleavage/methylation domain-containing protein
MALMASQGRMTIFAPSKHFRKAGFTLIEVLIVLTIISIVLSLGMPAISRVTYQRLNSTTRKFVGTVRSIRNDSILLNQIHRLVFDLEKQTWWVENQKQFKLLGTEDPDKKSKDKEAPPSNFTFTEKYSSKPVPLPPGIISSGVYKEKEGLVKNGLVYIHFFPSGFNEAALVYLQRDGDEDETAYTLQIPAASGKIGIFPRRLTQFEEESK